MKKIFILLIGLALIALFIIFYFINADTTSVNQGEQTSSQASKYLEKIDSSEKDEFRALYNAEFEQEAVALDEREILSE